MNRTKTWKTAAVLLCAVTIGISGCDKKSAGSPAATVKTDQIGGASGIATDSAGNIYAADTDNHIIRKITPTGTITTVAGAIRMEGSADGPAAAARFNHPSHVAIDGAGNLYVSDETNFIIRKITPAGMVTTLAGTTGMKGYADGTGRAARFNYPTGIATDSTGNIYVADNIRHVVSSNGVIRKITPEGVVTTLAGSTGKVGSEDGIGTAASFRFIHDITIDAAGNLYVTDSTTIRKITPAGAVTTLAGTVMEHGNDDGAGAAARFFMPVGIATDSTGNIYVSDNGSIRKITQEGVVTTLPVTTHTVTAR